MPDDRVSHRHALPAGTREHARRRGVIHVGAHQGQEVDQYLAHGCEWIVLIEPNPDACRILRERFKSRVSVVNTNPVLVTSFPL